MARRRSRSTTRRTRRSAYTARGRSTQRRSYRSRARSTSRRGSGRVQTVRIELVNGGTPVANPVTRAVDPTTKVAAERNRPTF